MTRIRHILLALVLSSFSIFSGCTHSETSRETVVPPPAIEESPKVSADGKCFAIGRTAADQACYGFKTQKTCLESSRINCGWEAQ